MSPIEIPASAVDTDVSPEWGVRRTMTDFEATMWRMEADPRLRSPVAAVEVLDRTRTGTGSWPRTSGPPGSCPGPGCGSWTPRCTWAIQCGRWIRTST